MSYPVPALNSSLEGYFVEAAEQERQWVEEGYCVFSIVRDIPFWMARGIFTRQDMEAMLERESDRDYQKAQMADWFDDHCAQMDEYFAEEEAEEARLDAIKTDGLTFEDTQFFAVCDHFQAGWA